MQKICIVIPCYNEEYRLDKAELLSYISKNPQVHFCLANDGSTDGTLQLLNEVKAASPETILVLDKEKNSGKADTVRQGILNAYQWKEFEYFAYFDADFATPLEEVNNLLQEIEKRKAKFVLGARIKRLGATVERKRLRHLLGRVFSTFASMILKLPVYDTQCGAKLMSREWVLTAFEKPFLTSWLFDVEILARLRNRYGINELLSLIAEYPLNKWIEKGGSKIKFVHLLKVPVELFNIYRTYN